ncbi:MAG: cupin domain-containing protein [Pyrinomonadaceae bacterium]
MRPEADSIDAATVIESKDLDDDIDRFYRSGFRLLMILPADAPREALLFRDTELVRLRSNNRRHSGTTGWAAGRAGMEYRDLIPGRLGGRVIASHIRLTRGGEVPDHVHYHKIGFQMIYCVKGAIRVVYEDQGEPFWLRPGDCVLQPPEIRHRVLEAEAGSEVVEVGSPAEHETWIDHDLTLPTREFKPDRLFAGQRFVRHIAADAARESNGDDRIHLRDTGIGQASGGLLDAKVVALCAGVGSDLKALTAGADFYFGFVLSGELALAGRSLSLRAADNFAGLGVDVPAVAARSAAELLLVSGSLTLSGDRGRPSTP